MEHSPSMLRATLLGGAAFGLLGATPIVSLLNCACCSLVVGAGVFAAFLYSRDCRGQGAAFAPGSGAIVGLVAGMFYALTSTIVSGLLQWLFGGSVEEALEQMEQLGVEVPPEAEGFVEFVSQASPLLLLFVGFCFWLLVAAVFSTVGGLIGGAVFKVEPPAPGAYGPPAPPTIDVRPGSGGFSGPTPPG
jgi:hypothetical protein